MRASLIIIIAYLNISKHLFGNISHPPVLPILPIAEAYRVLATVPRWAPRAVGPRPCRRRSPKCRTNTRPGGDDNRGSSGSRSREVPGDTLGKQWLEL